MKTHLAEGVEALEGPHEAITTHLVACYPMCELVIGERAGKVRINPMKISTAECNFATSSFVGLALSLPHTS